MRITFDLSGETEDKFVIVEQRYKEPGFIYLTNLTATYYCSKRVGWIPKPNEAKEKDRISFDLMRQFRLVFGLSITEMEIVYGAYSITNPNGK